MSLILDAPPRLILPERPAIIRPRADLEARRLFEAAFPFAIMRAPPAGGGGALSAWTFITSVSVDATTLTVPTVQTGDFLMFADMPAKANSGSTQPAVVAPSGLTFTELVAFPSSTDTGGANRSVIYSWCFGRLVTNGASESGTVITGTNTGSSSGFRRKFLLVFRPTGGPPTSFSVHNASKVWSGSDPAATSTALSGAPAPFLTFGTYRGEGALVSPTFSTTADGDVILGTTTQVSYKIHNSTSSATLAVDQGDSGSSTVTTSFGVKFS